MEKRKLIMEIILILLLIVIVIAISILIINKNDNKDNNKDNLKNVAKKLLENNYLYYYYTYGDIDISEENIEIDNIVYYKVKDKDIKSLKEYNNLIEKNFVNNIQVNLLEEKEKNNYIEIDGILYVNKIENPCKNIVKYDLNNITLEGNDSKKNIIFDETRSQMYYEDGNWKLGGNNYYCIETEK